MDATYALLQYAADPYREDGITIGAVVVCPSMGYFRGFVPKRQVDRLRCYDPGFRAVILDNVQEELDEAAANYTPPRPESDAPDFLSEMLRCWPSSKVRFGRWKPIEYTGHVYRPQLDATLREIIDSEVYWRLGVDEPDNPAKKQSFKSWVLNLFEQRGLIKSGDRDESFVKEDYYIEGIHLTFDFGFQNGRPNVIEIADLSSVLAKDEDAIVKRAADSLVRLQRLRHATDLDVKAITVLSGSRAKGQVVSPTVQELRDLSHEVYYAEEDQEWRRLIADIEEARAGH